MTVHRRSPAHTFGPMPLEKNFGLTFIGVGSSPPSRLQHSISTNGEFVLMPTSLDSTSNSTSLPHPHDDGGHVMASVNHVKASAPKVSLKFRTNGTVLWPQHDVTPGPGAYDEQRFNYIYKKTPKFSVPHARLTSLKPNYDVAGPFATF